MRRATRRRAARRRPRPRPALDRRRPQEPRRGRGRCSSWSRRPTRCIEGFRPGVMERLGLGPDVCLARNPQLVYGRMTGWGQEGPYAQAAGHDINYIALAGALGATSAGPARRPIAAAQPGRRLRRRRHAARLRRGVRACSRPSAPGEGQVVDAAMVDGAAVLMTMFHGCSRPWASGRRSAGTNLLDTGAHFYDVYETRRRQVRLARVDRAAVLRRAARVSPGSSRRDLPPQMDRVALARAEGAVRRRCSRRRPATSGARSWRTPTCASRRCSSMAEAPQHPHNVARGTFVERRRRGAAGAGAALQPHARRRSSGRRRTPASTPTRCWPTGGRASARRAWPKPAGRRRAVA